jgi:hypothetical protein
MTHGFEALTAGRSRRHGRPGYSRCLPAHRRPRRRTYRRPAPSRPCPADGTTPAALPALADPEHPLSAPACSPAWITPPVPASTPGSSLSPRGSRGCCGATAPGPTPSPGTRLQSRLHGTSATGSARPTPSTTSGSYGGRRVITRPRPRPRSRPWTSTATSGAGRVRPRRSTRQERCTGSAVSSRGPRNITGRPQPLGAAEAADLLAELDTLTGRDQAGMYLSNQVTSRVR